MESWHIYHTARGADGPAGKEEETVDRRVRATPTLVRDYFRLFVNRRAYTLQSARPHPESGRHYYFRPKERGSGAPLSLTEKTVSRHLEGEITIGLYAINPSSQRCKWVAIDADYKNAMEDLLKLQYHLTQDGVESALEMSRRGGHLWIFLTTPLLARKCRIYIYDLARRLGVPVKGSGLADGIEVFPKHDAIATGAFGNALRGPLGIHRGANRRFWFYGTDYTLEAQMKFLKRLRRGHGRGVGPSSPRAKNFRQMWQSPQRESKPIREQRTGRSQKTFCILDHVGKTRIVGKNHVARCPSCA